MARPRSTPAEPANDSQPDQADSAPNPATVVVGEFATGAPAEVEAAYDAGYAAGLAAGGVKSKPLFETAKALIDELKNEPEADVIAALDALEADLSERLLGERLSASDRELLLVQHRRHRASLRARQDALDELTRPRRKQPPQHPSETTYEHVR